jgi:hypothetical protein
MCTILSFVFRVTTYHIVLSLCDLSCLVSFLSHHNSLSVKHSVDRMDHFTYNELFLTMISSNCIVTTLVTFSPILYLSISLITFLPLPVPRSISPSPHLSLITSLQHHIISPQALSTHSSTPARRWPTSPSILSQRPR